MKNKLFVIFALTAAAVALGFWFGLQPDRTVVSPALHGSMESVEAVSALLLALFLLARRHEDILNNSTLLALGFLGMGILNAGHAVSAGDDQFVFLRTAASLSGGLGFGLLWLPAGFKEHLNRRWLPWAVITGSLILCGLAYLYPELLPVMLSGTQFTGIAVVLNVLSGLLFLAGAARILFSFRTSDALEDELFSLIGIFFGISGLAFPYSAFLSESWWYWHALRLIGSLLVLGLLVHKHLRTAATLKTSLADREKAEHALRRSSGLNRTILDSMNDAISLLDVRDFTIVGVNRAFLEEYGYSNASEIVGRHCYEITHRRKDICTAPDDVCPLQETVRTGNHFAVDHVHYNSRGEKRFIEVSTSPIKDEIGNVVQVVHVAKDITGRKKAEEERERLLSDIARSNKDLEQFAYVASHDLKEPLRMVSAYVQLLERKYKGRLDDKADKYIAFAVEGAERMQKLIEGLLAYSRVTRGSAPRFAPVDTARVFSQAVSNLATAIRECKAKITRDELPVVPGDETQLLQLFQNLIGNAVKYRKTGAEPRVHASAKKQENAYLFSIRDNGIGIPSTDHERIFQIFQRLHSHDQYSGAGIGLAVCKRIVERHQGRIWIESAPGEGSTFFFTIPAIDSEGR